MTDGPASRRRGEGRKQPGLSPKIRSFQDDGSNLKVVVDLKNPLDRTVYYIADVRGIDYDPTAQRLKLRLTDRGRVVLHGSLSVIPQFRAVEPKGQASLALTIPRAIVRFRASEENQDPTPRLAETTIAGAAKLEVEIGWSEIPYYEDTRESSAGANPIEEWETGLSRATLAVRGGEADVD